MLRFIKSLFGSKPSRKPQKYVVSKKRRVRGPARTYEYNGRKVTFKELAQEVGIPLGTLNSRISRGMSWEKAISYPIIPRNLRLQGADKFIEDLKGKTAGNPTSIKEQL